MFIFEIIYKKTYIRKCIDVHIPLFNLISIALNTTKFMYMFYMYLVM